MCIRDSASSALPTLFSPVQVEDRMLIDGGIVDNYPIDEMLSKGMDVIIGVDVQTNVSSTDETSTLSEVVTRIASFQTRKQMASKKAKNDFILYAHDDFYFCPEWDLSLKNEIDKIGHNRFYLSGIMMNNGPIKFNAGSNLKNFDEIKVLNEYKNFNPVSYTHLTLPTKA